MQGNTTECRATKFNPFKLLYGVEAMSPEELKHKSIRTQNNIEPSLEADLTKLDILQASDNLDQYQKETQNRRNKKIVSSKGSRMLKQSKSSGPNGMGHTWCSTPTDQDLTTWQTLKEMSCSIHGMLTV